MSRWNERPPNKSESRYRDDLDIRGLAQNRHGYVLVGSLEGHINHSVAHLQLSDFYSWQRFRKLSSPEKHGWGRIHNFDSERSLKKEKYSRSGPGLRRAGHRIQRGSYAGAALEAAKQFRQAVVTPDFAGQRSHCIEVKTPAFFKDPLNPS
jgi:hypothetical protein